MNKIIFDVMSGEAQTIEALNAAVDFAKKNPNIGLVLVGSKQTFNQIKNYPSNIEFKYSTQKILMNETSALMFKRKKDSSLTIAINQLLEDKNAKAIVSCANTGAYVTGAFLTSKPFKKDLRPGMAGFMYSQSNKLKVMIDQGAVVDPDASTLENFALMGSVYHSILTGTKSPKVSLLSNGIEDHKGNNVTKEAFKLMRANKNINFIGNEEAKTLLEDKSDVFVADGFTGNILLKGFQATGQYISHSLKANLSKNIFRKIGALFVMGALKDTKKTIYAIEIAGGSVMLGLNHIVIKSPGSAKQISMYNSLKLAKKLIDKDIVNEIKRKLK